VKGVPKREKKEIRKRGKISNVMTKKIEK